MGWCQSWMFFALPVGTAPAWLRSRAAHPENLCWPSLNRGGVGQSWAAAPPPGVAVSLEGEALGLATRLRGVRGTPPARTSGDQDFCERGKTGGACASARAWTGRALGRGALAGLNGMV